MRIQPSRKFAVHLPGSSTYASVALCVVFALAGCATKSGISSTGLPLVPSSNAGSSISAADRRAEICKRVIDAGGKPLDPASQAQFRVDFNISLAQRTEFQAIDRAPQVLSAVPPVYPSWARRCGVEGRVVLFVQIDKEGRVVRTFVIGNPSASLSAAAATAVQQWRFQPHTVGGKSTAVAFLAPINFELSTPPLGGRQVVEVGRPGVNPELARIEQELTYRSAWMEADLGPDVRYVTFLTPEVPLLEYARAFAARAQAVENANHTFTQTNRVVAIIDRNGGVVSVTNVDAKDDTSRKRNEAILARAADLGPLPETPGGAIRRIAILLPFEDQAK